MDLQSQISVTVGMRVKTICPNEMKSKDANGHGGGGETRGGGGGREGGEASEEKVIVRPGEEFPHKNQ